MIRSSGHGSERIGGGLEFALSVIEREILDEIRAVKEDRAEGNKDETDEEEGGEDRSGGEDRLPRFESLLLERGIRGPSTPFHLGLFVLLEHRRVLLLARLAREESHRRRTAS